MCRSARCSPTSACDIFEPGDHGTTFGGNPIACAAGVATMRTILDEGLLDHATKMGAYLDSKLDTLREKHSIITSTRGLGLMRAFEMAEPRAQDMMDLALKRGVLILNAGPHDSLRAAADYPASGD